MELGEIQPAEILAPVPEDVLRPVKPPTPGPSEFRPPKLPENLKIKPSKGWDLGKATIKGIKAEDAAAALTRSLILPATEALAALRTSFAMLTAWFGVVSIVGDIAMIGMSVYEIVEFLKPQEQCDQPSKYTSVWDSSAMSMKTLLEPCASHQSQSDEATATAVSAETTSGPLAMGDEATATAVSTGTASEPLVTGDEATAIAVSAKTTSESLATMQKRDDAELEAPAITAAAMAVEELNKHNPHKTRPVQPLWNPTLLTPGLSLSTASTCLPMSLHPGFTAVPMAGYPCPVLMSIECTVGWGRYMAIKLHLRTKPDSMVNQDYCQSFDMTGHERAVDAGCLPDFETQDCLDTYFTSLPKGTRAVKVGFEQRVVEV